TELVWCHAWDYDLYLELARLPAPAHHPKTAVFLDEYAPFHEDNVYCGRQSAFTAEQYYPVLLTFFEYIEKNFGYRIVVAAHPRSQYEKHPDFFKGREVVRGRTAELVKNADLVIARMSASINFAVIFRKPLLFFTSDALNNTPEARESVLFSAYFKQTPVNISRPYTLDGRHLTAFDAELYARYQQEFIKRRDSPEKPFWQIVADTIKTIPSREGETLCH
ncbi:MAG: hypothetical protein PHU21_12585, partial [Elusimicrobia bacterium]|nr:hypothetical protein [Elusimicrobiota bacterium]